MEKGLTMGNIAGVRGQPWAVLSPGHGKDGEGVPPYRLVSYATLTRAVYRAVSEDPIDANVKETLRQGLENVQVYRASTPRDVVIWLRDFHNEFHSGPGYTVVELLKLADAAELKWKAEAIEKGYEVSNAAQCKKFIMETYPKKFSSINVYHDAKAAIHSLRRMDMLDQVLLILGRFCDFKELKNDAGVFIVHELAVKFEK
eukprot:4327370-Pyramimonas_sp.AAC.1